MYTAWKPVRSDADEIAKRAAQFQHRYALRIRIAIDARGWTDSDYAEAAGRTVLHVQKILRGQATMSLTDIATADLLIGHVSEWAWKSRTGAAAKQERERLAAGEATRMARIAPKLIREGKWTQQGRPRLP
jgi:hypothetical protein